jgi:hypothetical protein
VFGPRDLGEFFSLFFPVTCNLARQLPCE